jgi:hypothetical protein
MERVVVFVSILQHVKIFSRFVRTAFTFAPRIPTVAVKFGLIAAKHNE